MANFDIDSDFVRKLAGLLEESGLSEIEYADGDRRIRLSRSINQTFAAPAVAMPVAAPMPAAAPAAAAVPAGPPAGTVRSPMVGTAYLAAEPGGTPFVRVGDSVKPGQTLLIIEAMKVMNPIKADKGGTVTQVLIGDAQPVEYDEPLIVIQ